MVKGETVMPVPEGDITTSEILSADAEEATEEYKFDEEENPS
jgi:hypothetical protein